MYTPTLRQATRIVVLALATISAFVSFQYIYSGDSGTPHVIAEYSIPIYPTVVEAANAADGVLEVQIDTMPTSYKDFGEDGKPDFPGQEPELVEIVRGRVISVISGDFHLQGREILLSQSPASQNQEDNEISSRMKKDSHVIVIGNLVTANNDVANGAQVWVPYAGGQGVLDVNADHSISVRSNLIYESDFTNGQSMSRNSFEALIK